MKGHNLELEELHISEPIRLPFHGLDLVVGSLQGTGGYGEIIVSKDAGPVCGEGFGYGLEHGNVR